MKALKPPATEQGIVIVITLFILVIMTAMGVALVHTTGKNSERAQGVSNNLQALSSAESCSQQVIQWLETTAASAIPCQNVTPGNICRTSNHFSSGMSHSRYAVPNSAMPSGDKYKNLINQHGNQCDLALLTTEADQNTGLGTGFSVGQGTNYTGTTPKTKYIYKITARSSSQTLETRVSIELIVSMIF